MKKVKRFLKIVLISIFVLTVGINVYVNNSAQNKCFIDVNKLPTCQTVIIFGAGINKNKPSDFLKQRLDAGIELYREKKVHKILLSGDDGGDESDEITVMKNYCITHNIDPNNIIIDTKGYDTYKTIERAKKIFKVDKAIFVSQEYHLNRAVFIGNKLGIETYGKIAEKKESVSLKYIVREYFANVKAFFKTIT
ncbi:YdcF family protein [Flavobacterium psychrophilum]|uniref:SanA/YdcF family protein n=1 Tax=Flavobacterium psychrophilum TaxID=96345 RepID=UPI001C8FA444|nr:ElyC/SanA/YdcF family protein [Flavobacterium psychrophilum]QZK99518.1 YdcF family protein [Flavobacterium psychrophilum]